VVAVGVAVLIVPQLKASHHAQATEAFAFVHGMLLRRERRGDCAGAWVNAALNWLRDERDRHTERERWVRSP